MVSVSNAILMLVASESRMEESTEIDTLSPNVILRDYYSFVKEIGRKIFEILKVRQTPSWL